MNFLDKMERKHGRYALKNLPMFIIATYVAGYVLELLTPEMLGYLTLEPYYILHGQVWRLVTWILIPPSSLDIFTIIMLFFYFSIGQTLERTWGSFKFDVYIFSGLIFTVIGAFLLVQGNLASRVAIIASLFNFIVFFLISGRFSRFTPHQIHRRQEFKRNVKKVQPKNGPKHKCAICGRTELDGDNLEFRFCSKCDGNYEYCQDHLFTHEHRRSK